MRVGDRRGVDVGGDTARRPSSSTPSPAQGLSPSAAPCQTHSRNRALAGPPAEYNSPCTGSGSLPGSGEQAGSSHTCDDCKGPAPLSQDHFTLRRQTGINIRGGGHRTGSGRLARFMERIGRCQGAAQGVLIDPGLVLGQREMALAIIRRPSTRGECRELAPPPPQQKHRPSIGTVEEWMRAPSKAACTHIRPAHPCRCR